MNTVRLHNIVLHTKALGPETRAAIWFQGCNRRCVGCMSPNSRPLNGGRVADVDRLIDTLSKTEGIEGVTISGGEPFLQIEALYTLLKGIRTRSNLGVIIYTGNTIEELKSLDNAMVDEILSGLTDIIIDGEYIDEQNDGSSLKGSANQTVHFLTARYLPYRELYEGSERNAEVFISGDETLFVGVPDRETLMAWKKTTEDLSDN